MYKLFIAASSVVAASVITSSAAHAQVVTATGGEVGLFTQKNVVDRLIVGDSVEVELAKLAVSQTKNPAVREFATQLVTDHRTNLDSLRRLAEMPDVGRAAPAGDSTVTRDARVFTQLKALPADSSFDRAFVNDQIERHQRVVENLKKWRASANTVATQLYVGRMLPIAEQHLARAQAVAGQVK